MSLITDLLFLAFAVLLMLTGTEAKPKPRECLRNKVLFPKSCLDHLRNGNKTSGDYIIYEKEDCGSSFTVYCDMTSEAGAAWTLVESFALKNVKMTQFQKIPLKLNGAVNENSPNWGLFRIDLARMQHIKLQSTHWRITCDFQNRGVDYTDYVRGNFATFDIMTFVGYGICSMVDYINIRGSQCASCKVTWFQSSGNTHGLHVDSSSKSCDYKDWTKDAVSSEDNFGYYATINENFRCTSSPESTTNMWHGGYQ